MMLLGYGIKTGAMKSEYDETVFYRKRNAVLQGITACRVAHFIFSGTALFMDDVVKSLKEKFKVSAESEDRFTYIGLQIDQNANYITITRQLYQANYNT